MAIEYDEATFAEQHLHCDNCGWSGIGNDAHIVDFYGVAEIKQVECPECNTILGNLKSNNDNLSDPGDPLSIGIG